MKRSKKKQRFLPRAAVASGGKAAGPPPVGSVLYALTASAMALPGIAGHASADSPVKETTVDQDYFYYGEDDLGRKHTSPGGERERMEIHSYDFRIATPLGERADLEAEGTFETLSGASPWFVLPDAASPDGRPIQSMSEPTIDEQRGDLLLEGSYFFDEGKVSGSGGFSIENDYYSANVGLGGERSFNDKNTTLSAGAGFSYDWIRPTDCKELDRTCTEDKRNYTVFGGFTQILTRHSALQSTFSFGYSEGFLTDPYKRAWVGPSGSGATVRDARPDERKQYTWLTQYRHHISALDATLHFDYKFYADDWSIISHTFDVAWYQSLPWQIQIVPSIRYYSQSQADFYEVFYDAPRSNDLYSSDYRLSPFGAFGYGFKITKDVEDWPGKLDWQIAASYERYNQEADLALENVEIENPGLVGFNLYAVRLTVKF